MSIKFIWAAIALVMITAACNNQNSVAMTLNDPEQTEALLDSIAGNQTLLQKVKEKASAKGASDMNRMNMENDTATMSMMMHNPAMMTKMMNMMMARCEQDTAICKDMCTSMMKSPKMKAMMMDMMKKDGRMGMERGNGMEGMKMDKK